MKDDGNDEEIPYHLMPVAAFLLTYTVLAVGWTVRDVALLLLRGVGGGDDEGDASTITRLGGGGASERPTSTPHERRRLTTTFLLVAASSVASALAYSHVAATVEGSVARREHRSYDPYAILGVEPTANVTVVKRAYRDLVLPLAAADTKETTPENRALLVRYGRAYRALTDPAQLDNYRRHGHPSGPPPPPPLLVASLPAWLYRFDRQERVPPRDMVAAYLSLPLAALVAWYLLSWSKDKKRKKEQDKDDEEEDKKRKNRSPLSPDAQSSVSREDLTYLLRHLRPDSSHEEVLYAVVTTPESVRWATEDHGRVLRIRRDRLDADARKKKKAPGSKQRDGNDDLMNFDDLVNQDGWDEEEDDDDDDAAVDADKREARERARKAEIEKEKEMEQLKQATGKAVALLEGVDDGVLGQQWVERTLASKGVWPPAMEGCLATETFDWEGKRVSAVEHPALRRVLCMTVGRLNSFMLNSHPELLEAGSQKKIDQTYFQANMLFRQRATMLLEAALRVSMTVRSQRLASTVIETVAMFKIGCKHTEVPWFNGMMTRQYNMLPRCKILDQQVKSAGGFPELATNDMAELEISLERIHAENFTKQKIAMFQKQGIPPQVGLQTYREGWWFLLRMEKLGGDGPDADVPPPLNLAQQPLLKELKDDVDMSVLEVFEKERPENRLLTAWPMILQNVAQKLCKVKIQIPLPDEPGKYRYYVGIKSQDFLGADQELTLDVNVVDSVGLNRPPASEAKEE